MYRQYEIAGGQTGEKNVTRTTNTQLGTTGKAAVDKAKPTAVNTYGHIVRFKDANDHLGGTFTWEVFALAKDVTDAAGQMFGSPDGIWVDPDNRVFVLTDGEQPGKQNDQLLVASGVTREFKRLFTGVKGCEVTGVTVTPDRRTMFVNLQHPGDAYPSIINFPATYEGFGVPVPRHCTILITRINGVVIVR